MSSRVCRWVLAVLAVGMSWACAACGRLGFDALPQEAATIDVVPVEMDAGVVHDAHVVSVDAAAPVDAGTTVDPKPIIQDAGASAIVDATTTTDAKVDATMAADAGPTACAAVPDKVGGNLKIDDMEDGDSFILVTDGRRGSWYVNNDATRGYQMPALGAPFTVSSAGAAGSTYSVHTTGSGFNTWGAALGVVLSDANGKRCPYDVTGTRGLRFVAKGSGNVTVQVATSATVPISQGGRCLTNCEDFYAYTIELNSEWTTIQLPWPLLTQEGWGTRASFAPNTVMFFEFAFDVGSYFDLYIDDLQFY